MYFNVVMNNVRQHRNNVAIFNVKFHNVGKRGNNVVKTSFSEKNKKIQIKSSNRMHEIESFNYYLIMFFTLLPMLGGTCKRVLAKPRSSYKIMKNNALQELNLKRLAL